MNIVRLARRAGTLGAGTLALLAVSPPGGARPSGGCPVSDPLFRDGFEKLCASYAFAAPDDAVNRIVANAGQDVLEAVTPDPLSIAYLATGGCGGAVLPTVWDPPAPPRFQGILAGVLLGGAQNFALTSDGLTLIGRSIDGRGLREVSRAARNTDFEPAADPAAFAAINAQVAGFGAAALLDNPVLGAEDRVLLYRVSGAPVSMNNGYYETRRADRCAPFPAGTRVPSAGLQAGPAGDAYFALGSLSADGLSLFVTYDTPSSPPNFWRTDVFERASLASDFPDSAAAVIAPAGASVFRAKVNRECTALFANGRLSACATEDIFRLARP
jgi:hypothetical protein